MRRANFITCSAAGRQRGRFAHAGSTGMAVNRSAQQPFADSKQKRLSAVIPRVSMKQVFVGGQTSALD